MTNTIIISATATTRRPDALSRCYGEAVQVREIKLETDHESAWMAWPEQMASIVDGYRIAMWNYDWEDVSIVGDDQVAGRNLRMPYWLTIWGRSYTYIGIVVA